MAKWVRVWLAGSVIWAFFVFLYSDEGLDLSSSRDNEFYNFFLTIPIGCAVIWLVLFLFLRDKEKKKFGDHSLELEKGNASAARPASNQSSNTSIQQPMAAAGPTISSIDDDGLYQQALEELDNDQKVAATWSRSFAEASGDEQKAKAYYIQLRVAGLKATAEVNKNEMEQEKQEAVEAAELKMKEIEREKREEIEAKEWVDSLKKEKKRNIKIGFITLGIIMILVFFAAFGPR
tara:strand:- start:1284 stop:1985 length:702 start_codon:yes stop_codon:yes gene_type:complete